MRDVILKYIKRSKGAVETSPNFTLLPDGSLSRLEIPIPIIKGRPLEKAQPVKKVNSGDEPTYLIKVNYIH